MARLAVHDARNEYTSRFKNTFNAIVSDPFLASTKKAENTMRQIVADHFCNSFFIRRNLQLLPSRNSRNSRNYEDATANELTKNVNKKKEVTQTAAGLIGKVQIYGEQLILIE